MCLLVSFWGAPIHADIIKFYNLLQRKNQWFGNKAVCGFCITLILKEIMTFESQRVHTFCSAKLWTVIESDTESKLENPTHCFSASAYIELQIKSKTEMN